MPAKLAALALLALSPAARAADKIVQGAPIYADQLANKVKSGKATPAELDLFADVVRQTKDGYQKWTLAQAFESGSLLQRPDVETEILPRLRALRDEYKRAPDRMMLDFSGDLGHELDDWDNRLSPQARRSQARTRRHEKLMNLFSVGLLMLMPLTLLVGTLVAAFARGGLAYWIIHPSQELTAPLRHCLRWLAQSPAILLIPLATAAAAAGVFGLLFWRILADAAIHPGMSDSAIKARAVMHVFSPPVVAAYFCAGAVGFFANAVFIKGFIASETDEPDDIFRGVWAALRNAPAILAVAAFVLTAFLIVDFLREKFGGALSRRQSELVDLAVAFAESGTLIMTNLTLAVIVDENVGPLEAMRRAAALVRPEQRALLRGSAGAAALRYEWLPAVVMIPMLFCITSLPLVGVLSDSNFNIAAKLGLPLSFTDVHLVVGAGMASSALCAAFVFSGFCLLDAVLASGLYLFGRRQTTADGLSSPETIGLLERLTGSNAF